MEKIQKWAYLANIASAIAVIVSLVYVGIQVKENTSAQLSQTDVNLTSLGFDWDAWYRDPEFVAIVARAEEDYQSLSTVEKLQFDKHVTMGLNLWVYSFDSHQRGQITNLNWQAWDAYFSRIILNESWRSVWAAVRTEYAIDFVLHVDTIVGRN